MKKEITLTVLCALMVLCTAALFAGCGSPAEEPSGNAEGPLWSDLAAVEEMPLQYATQFRVTEYEGGYELIDITDSGRYLVVSEGASVPAGLDKDIVVLYRPLDNIYLVATSAMDLFRALDGLDSITLSGTDADGWYIPEAKEALENGSIRYAGKYSSPDYELIYSTGCDLAIESTMIYHNPDVKEQLEKLGVPVLVEHSSYESHPLGRMEWLKLYGVLLDKEDEAEEIFAKEVAALDDVLIQSGTDKTVAFFYITTTGTVNVRKSGDYVVKMIELAGGNYVFPELGGEDNALSTVNMTMEAFYDGAKNADILIYNSAIDNELQTIDQLLAKSGLLADFKAVQAGDVWCTGKNLFQEPMGLGRLIIDIHTILTEEEPDPAEVTYLHRLTGGGA
ncbi:MAG: ABC transporter substrate-binding protein [Firmicutes bacterium]|nr:ABC transporter substrate-binding protein [Bacillota bacterium]